MAVTAWTLQDDRQSLTSRRCPYSLALNRSKRPFLSLIKMALVLSLVNTTLVEAMPRLFIHSERVGQFYTSQELVFDASRSTGTLTPDIPRLLYTFELARSESPLSYDFLSPAFVNTTTAIAHHFLESAGLYIVRLTVQDADGFHVITQPITLYPSQYCFRFTLFSDSSSSPNIVVRPNSVTKLLCQVEDPRDPSELRRKTLTRMFYQLGERPALHLLLNNVANGATTDGNMTAQMSAPSVFSRDLDTDYDAWTVFLFASSLPQSVPVIVASRGTVSLECAIASSVFSVTVVSLSSKSLGRLVESNTDSGPRIAAYNPLPSTLLWQDACSPNFAFMMVGNGTEGSLLGGLILYSETAFGYDSSNVSSATLRDILRGNEGAGPQSACQTPLWNELCPQFQVLGLVTLRSGQIVIATSIGLVKAFALSYSTEYQFAKVTTGIDALDNQLQFSASGTGETVRLVLIGPTACPDGFALRVPTDPQIETVAIETIYVIHGQLGIVVSRDFYHSKWKRVQIPFSALGLADTDWRLVSVTRYESDYLDVFLICPVLLLTSEGCQTILHLDGYGSGEIAAAPPLRDLFVSAFGSKFALGYTFTDRNLNGDLHIPTQIVTHREAAEVIIAIGDYASWKSFDGGWTFQISFETITDNDGHIVSVATSPANDDYALLMSTGSIFYGRVGLPDMVEVRSPVPPLNETLLSSLPEIPSSIRRLGNILFDAMGDLYALELEYPVDGYPNTANRFPIGLLSSPVGEVRHDLLIRSLVPVGESVAASQMILGCPLIHYMISKSLAIIKIVDNSSTAAVNHRCKFTPATVNRVLKPNAYSSTPPDAGFLIKQLVDGYTVRAAALGVPPIRAINDRGVIRNNVSISAGVGSSTAVISITNGNIDSSMIWQPDVVGMHMAAGFGTFFLTQVLNDTVVECLIIVDSLSSVRTNTPQNFLAGEWVLYDLRSASYALTVRDCPYESFTIDIPVTQRIMGVDEIDGEFNITSETNLFEDYLEPSDVNIAVGTPRGRSVYIDVSDEVLFSSKILPATSATIPIVVAYSNRLPFNVSILEDRNNSIPSRDRLADTLTLSILSRENKATTAGVSTIAMRPVESSLKCRAASTRITVNQGCPPSKKLEYVFQHSNVDMIDFLYGDPKLENEISYIEKLPINYRPPSKLGKNIPTSRNVYNVDPSEPLSRHFFDKSREMFEDSPDGKNSLFKQCRHKKDRKACGCTDAQRFSQFTKDSDCIDRVERVFFKDVFTPRLQISELERIRSLESFGDRTNANKMVKTPLDYRYRLIELNERTDYCFDVDGVDCTDKDEVRKTWLQPDDAGIIWEGDELYHFAVLVELEQSYCNLTTEFKVFIVAAPLQQTTVWVIISLVAVFVSLTLFAAYLLYYHFYIQYQIDDVYYGS